MPLRRGGGIDQAKLFEITRGTRFVLSADQFKGEEELKLRNYGGAMFPTGGFGS